MSLSYQTPRLLRFPGLPYSVAFAGAPDVVVHWLAHRWMAELDESSTAPPAYRVRFRPDDRIAYASVTMQRRTAATARHRVVGSRSQLSMQGGRVLIEPGEPSAEVEVHPAVLETATALEPLAEAALGHALALQGGCFLHAAALELRDRRLLILGATGSGKSTFAAAALASGGRVISDDSLLLGLDRRGRPLMRSARRDVWLRRDSLSVIPPELRIRCRHQRLQQEDLWQLPRGSLSGRFLEQAAPDGMILLRRDLRLRRFRLQPVDQAQALASLLRATSALYLAGPRFEKERRGLMRLFVALAEGLTTCEVRLGRELVSEPCRLLDSLLDALPEALA